MARLTKIGTYPLGLQTVALYANLASNDAEVDLDKSPARMTVGFAPDEFRDVVGLLVHEAMEFSCLELGLRYSPTPDISQDNGGFLFCMTHTQFSEASARAGHFISACMSDLAKAYIKVKK